MKKYLFPFMLSAMLLASCGSGDESRTDTTPDDEPTETTLPDLPFARGADVGWVSEEEDAGMEWHDAAGNVADVFKILRDECGFNAIRLRVWVNPANGYNGLEDVIGKAKRAHALGFMLMIDFHLSDNWADPGKQNPPAAWSSYSLDDMKSAVAAHIDEVLSALKTEGIEPQWVQVGNEVRNGMLWPLGQADINARNFTELINAGYDAVKKVCPKSYVIVHVDQGDVMSHYDFIFGILATYGGRYDMIGMSVYPSPSAWQTSINQLISNINNCWNRWNRPVMVCETGMNWQKADTCRQMLAALINGCRNSTSGHGKGVFYWEPQSTPGMNGGYDMGAFTPEGRPTDALKAFKEDADAHPDK